MLRILCESNFYESLWCQRILEGIVVTLKKKRRQYEVICDDEYINPSCEDEIFLVGSNDKWINERIEIFNSVGVVPIVVCNQNGRICKGKYHSVTTDIENAMSELYEFLIKDGRTRFVFYGLNESSASDRGKAECFGALCKEGMAVIENNGSIDDAFTKLYGRINEFDTVICANNFVAVLLVKRLLEVDEKLLKRIRIVSCAKIMLSSVYDDYIVTQGTDFEELGRVSAELYEFLSNKEYVSSVTLSVKCHGIENAKNVIRRESEIKTVSEDAFYKDSTILSALKIDKLFSVCKNEDLQILRLICMGKTYTNIAEECFMSESNVKYHVKKYAEILGLKGREELRKMLKEYIIY